MQNVINLLFSIAILILGVSFNAHCKEEKKQVLQNAEADSLVYRPHFYNKTPKEGLKEALTYYDIKFPEIVYAQAVLETGNFKSVLCTEDNNLFGLYNSRKREYHRFSHWTESIEAYAQYIQKRYRPPEDYYRFLQRIGYAEDKQYISKLKKVVKENDTRRSE